MNTPIRPLILAFAVFLAAIATVQESAAQELGGTLGWFHQWYPFGGQSFDFARINPGPTENPLIDSETNWSRFPGAVSSGYYSAAVPYLPNNKRTYRLEYRSDHTGTPNTTIAASSNAVWIDDGLMAEYVPGPGNLPPPQGPLRIRFKFHIKWSWSPANGNTWSFSSDVSWSPSRFLDHHGGQLHSGNDPVNAVFTTPFIDFTFGQWRWFQMHMAYITQSGVTTPPVSTVAKMTYAGAEVIDGQGNVVDPSRWKLWRGQMPTSGNPGGTPGNEMESGLLLPIVALAPVTNLTSTTATLNGSVNPNGFTTTARFEYGTTMAYGSTAAVPIFPADGEAAQNVSANLTNLTPGTLYHYRLSATNAGGTSNTDDATFTTAALALMAWRQTYFGTTSDTGDAADLANPEGDAYTNLAEYALVLEPTAFSTGPVGERFTYPEGDRLRLVFNRDPARHDVTIEVLAADDLAGPWTPIASSVLGAETAGAGYYGGDSAGPGLKTVEVRDLYNVDDPAHPRRFLHLRITR